MIHLYVRLYWFVLSYGVVQDKVDVVKMTMQDNIQQMLANEERLDQISENAENLNEQVSGKAGIFSFSLPRYTSVSYVYIDNFLAQNALECPRLFDTRAFLGSLYLETAATSLRSRRRSAVMSRHKNTVVVPVP